MRTLKRISGILLATVGVLFVLAAVFCVFDPDPQIPLWTVGVMFVVLGLLPLGGAFALLWASVTAPSKTCPKCGGTEHRPAGLLRTSSNPWLLILVGLFASLWGASREEQVQCAHCETLYFTDTRATRIVGVLLWVFLLLVLFGMIVQQFEGRS